MQITTIGLDIAKNVFQVHGIDAAENVVVRKQLRRGQVIAFFKALAPCLVGMEACATSHYWARELTKLGHQVRLMPAKDVKAYVKRNKNDAADAEAICEAVRRPTMRFVAIKSAEQQARLMQHRARDLLIRQRTQLINAFRAHLAELGLAAAQGRAGVKELLTRIAEEGDQSLPVDARASLMVLAAQLQAVQTMIGSLEKRIVKQHRSNKESKRLQTIPGVGVIGASTITAVVPDPTVFRSGRDFAACGSSPERVQPAASASSDRSQNRATATCGASWSSVPIRCSGAPNRARKNILGSQNCWRGGRSRWWPSRSPTRWPASPGRYWPRAEPTGRLGSRQREAGLGNARMKLR